MIHLDKICVLCGKPCDGLGATKEKNSPTLYLCHPDDRDKPDCYRLWTVYGMRELKP